jgi:hypothetical protein
MSEQEVKPAAADQLTPHGLNSYMGSFASSGGQQNGQNGGKKGLSKKQRASLKRHTRKVKQQYKKLMRMMRKKF